MDEDLREHRLDAQADGLKLDEAAVAGIFAASDALAGQYRLRATPGDPARAREGAHPDSPPAVHRPASLRRRWSWWHRHPPRRPSPRAWRPRSRAGIRRSSSNPVRWEECGDLPGSPASWKATPILQATLTTSTDRSCRAATVGGQPVGVPGTPSGGAAGSTVRAAAGTDSGQNLG